MNRCLVDLFTIKYFMGEKRLRSIMLEVLWVLVVVSQL